jgi:aspartate carbamoyltransferase catalytic subunit
MKHFIKLEDFNKKQIQELVDRAFNYKNNKNIPKLENKICSLLFLEDSTRTLNSFQVACHRLGIFPLYAPANSSSLSKGETLEDTIATLAAIGANYLVLRHPDNYICDTLRTTVGDQISIINAGSGAAHHPTQALLDLMTIYENKKTLSGLKIAIAGDIKHSRVASSLITGLNIMGDNKINLIAPEQCKLEFGQYNNIEYFTDLCTGITNADVIVMLRIQKERFAADGLFSDYSAWQLTIDKLAKAKDDVIIMHPGPVNRAVEIADALVGHKKSRILQQVQNGVYCRMSILVGLGF